MNDNATIGDKVNLCIFVIILNLDISSFKTVKFLVLRSQLIRIHAYIHYACKYMQINGILQAK